MTTKPLIERVNGIRLRAGQVWQYRVDGYAGRPFTIAEIHMAVAYNTEGQYIALSHFAAYTFIRGPVDGWPMGAEGQAQAQAFQAEYDRDYGHLPPVPVVPTCGNSTCAYNYHSAQRCSFDPLPSYGKQPVVPEITDWHGKCDTCGLHADLMTSGDCIDCGLLAGQCAGARNDLNALTPDMPMSGLTDTRTAMLQAMRRSVSARTSWPCCPVSGEGYVADTVTWNPKRVLANRTTIGSQAEYGVRASWTCPCCDGEGEV